LAPEDRVTGPHAAPTIPNQISQRAGATPLAVVILAQNEEENLPHALASVAGWAAEIWMVVDAEPTVVPTERTAVLAREHGARLITHPWAGGGAQRNWALRNLPFGPAWVLFLDSDEVVGPELRAELSEVLASPPEGIAGFYVKRRHIFLGRWLRHGGYYPTWLLRVVRHRVARCEERWVDEHLIVDGPTARLRHDLIHEDRRELKWWVERHNLYSTKVADDIVRGDSGESIAPRWTGSQAERKRWWYERVYRPIPLGLRAVAYFLYRYVLRAGFLDGREGFIYNVMQALWYRVLIDAKVIEARRRAAGRAGAGDPVPEAVPGSSPHP